MTWNGTGGAGDQDQRPSESVRVDPGRPAIETVTPAIGAPVV
jgi:hypothetical protein